MAKDNPARRLHSLLNEAFAVADQHNSVDNLSSQTVWAEVFDVQDNDAEVLEYVEEIMLLLGNTKDAIRQLPSVRHKTYRKGVDYISARIYQRGLIGDKWNVQGKSLKHAPSMDSLEHVAYAIDDNRAYMIELTQDQLNTILSDVSTMLNEIVNSDLDEDIKTFLTVRLEEISLAIHHYKVRGSSGLIKVVEANIGSAFFKHTKLSNQQNPYLAKFLELMAKIGTVLGIMADTEGFLLPKVVDLMKQIPPG